MADGHGPPRPLKVLIGAAIAVAGLAAAGPASAALQPLPVIDLFTDDRVENVTVAAGPRGDAVVGWTGQNNPPATVLAAFRAGDGPFSPVEFLSTTANGEDPRFVFEPDGTVLAVWSHATTSAQGGYSTRPPGGTFGPEQKLPVGERFADVGINAAGTALAAWKSFVAGGNDRVVASKRVPGGVFEPPVPLSTPVPDNFIVPRVAVNAPGEAVVAWERETAPDASAVEARIGSVAGPAFGGLRVLESEASAGTGLGRPVVAIGPGGEAIVAWTRTAGGSSVVRYAVRPPGAADFRPALTLASDASGPQLGFGPGGEAVIAFAQGPDDARRASAVVRPPGGTPGPVAPLGARSERVRVASVTFDASGAAIVGWSRSVDDDTELAEAARRPTGGSFEPAVRIADMGERGGLALSAEPDGDVIAAWRVSLGPDRVVLRVGGLDNIPDPVTHCAAVPARRPSGGDGAARFTLSQRQLLINQRISQAAIRRLNAVQQWLDSGLVTGDLCGGGIGQADLGAGIVAALGGPAAALTIAAPRPLGASPARRGRPGRVEVSAGQLLINQRISQAAVRRANGLEARLSRGLTGGDLRDGQITQAKLAAGLAITSATPVPDPPAASRTIIAGRRQGARPGRVALSAGQLRINQRISQAAVRRANGLTDTLSAGLSGDDFQDGSITAVDLAPELR